jgi:hypothetical protein
MVPNWIFGMVKKTRLLPPPPNDKIYFKAVCDVISFK